MKKGRFNLVLVVMFVLHAFTIATGNTTEQNPTYNQSLRVLDLIFERFGSRDNLPDDRIRSLFQDSKGVLWIGTMNGVCQYDGYDFRRDINLKESLKKRTVWTTDICEDSLGNVWMGSTHGINVYNKFQDRVVHYEHDPKVKNSLTDNNIKTIYCDRQQNIWIGTEKGLLSFDRENNGFILHSENGLNCSINKIIGSYGSYIWLACSDGVIHYNTATNTSEFYKRKFKANPYGDRIWSLLEIDKNLLIGTGGEGLLLLTYDRLTNRYSDIHSFSNPDPLKDFEIFDMCKSDRGDVWLGTNRGLIRIQDYDSHSRQLSLFVNNPTNELSISNNRIYRLHIDHSDVLWCGTEMGLNKLNLGLLSFKFYSSFGMNAQDPVRAIYASEQGDIWVGKGDRGLYRIKQSDQTTTLMQIPASNSSLFSIRAITTWNNRIWVGSLGGAYTYSNQGTNFKMEIQDTAIFAYLVDSKSNLWIGTNHGLIKETPEGRKILFQHDKNDSLSIHSNFIRSIVEDHRGRIWIGFDNSRVNILDPATLKFHSLPKDPHGKTVLGSTVLSIVEIPENTIWIGSEICLNKVTVREETIQGTDIEIKNYFEEDGLVDKAINGMQKDDQGNLWLSTLRGLMRLNIKSETFDSFLTNLRFYQGSFNKSKNSLLLFGGAEGFVSFYPDKVITNGYSPQPQITDFKLFNQPIAPDQKFNKQVVLQQSISETKEITLNYKNNVFTLAFSSMHFANPEKNQYAYKMEGFDQKWNYTDPKNRSATYTNLDPGVYLFMVKASNGSGQWSDRIAKLKITILPPPWKTWYAILVYFILFNLLIYIIVHYNIVQIRQKNQIKYDQLEKEKINKIYQMKMDFFTDISHELRTPLSLILGPTGDLLNEPTLSEKIRSKVSMIQRNSMKLLNLVDELMTFRKIELGITDMKVSRGDLSKLISEIVDGFQVAAQKRNILLSYEVNREIEDIWFDQGKLEKVVNNLISNALKNTESFGEIRVTLSDSGEEDKSEVNKPMNPGSVLITISDTGKGIEKSELNSIFELFYQTRGSQSGFGVGLSLAKRLVELHHGNISVESQVGRGTTFTITLPIGNKHFSEDQFDESLRMTNSGQSKEDLKIETNAPDESNDQFSDLKSDKRPVLMIVEDNEELMEYLVSIFSSIYRITKAGDGEEAITILQKINPDVIISDVMMPKMDGLELCKKIKTEITTCHIPVILLTAKSELKNVIEGVEVGADLYISKPFQTELLKLQVENIIRNRNRVIEKLSSGENLGINEIAGNPLDEQLMKKILDSIKKNLSNDEYSVEELGKEIGMSRSNLFRKLKAITGKTPIEYIYYIRIQEGKRLLLEQKLSITEIADEVGFKNASSFSKSFKSQFGKSPQHFLSVEIDKQSNKNKI